jgi:hypothetical protein
MRGNGTSLQTAVGFLLADERRKIARGLPIHKHAVLDEIPFLAGHALVVVTDRREAGGLRAVGEEIYDL